MRDQQKDVFKNKGFYVSLLTGAICLVAVVAVSLNVFSDNSSEELPDLNEPLQTVEDEGDAQLTNEEPKVGEYVDNAENVSATPAAAASPTAENDVAEDTDFVDAPTSEEIDKLQAEVAEAEEQGEDEEDPPVQEANAQPKSKGKKKGKSDDEKPETMEVMGKDGLKNLRFNEDDQLLWPVAGNILMKYSMGNTIYHQTLGQYRCNPGIVIQSEVGTEVLSAYEGVVTDITENEELGMIVTASIGDEYSLMYGQLENLEVKIGDPVKEGQVLGTVAEPTKYYVEEGSNLFFQVLHGEETVDPMLLLR